MNQRSSSIPDAQSNPSGLGEASSGQGRATFFGTVYHKVSSRNQVAIPKQFIRILHDSNEGPLLLVRWQNEEFLRLYTKRRWDEKISSVKSRLDQMEELAPEGKADWIRRLSGGVENVEPDSQGRFVLPSGHAELLGQEVAFCGTDNRIEIWPAGARRQFMSASRSENLELGRELTSLLND